MRTHSKHIKAQVRHKSHYLLPVALLFVSGCTLFQSSAPVNLQSGSLPNTEAIFRVRIPENTPQNQTIQFTLLDEVTGLHLNPQHFRMRQIDNFTYQVTLQAPVGSAIKYRYSRSGDGVTGEYRANGQPVRYRLYHIDGPGVASDIVARWGDTPFVGATGRIVGQAADAGSAEPIPGLMISAGGIETITSADGSFILNGLPAGKHMLVAYALDGSYRTFKQEALVDANAATPANPLLQAAPVVNATFIVSVPEDTVPTVPLRIAGNLTQLGNTFADLNGSVSVIANRMPVMGSLPDGRYFLTMPLPAGADLRYKFTQGDGFWNTEFAADGAYRLRQLIVPEGVGEFTVEDRIDTWHSGPNNPIWFDVHAPEFTPRGEGVSIQFNVFGWMEPIPLWQAGENRWGLRLAGPTNFQNPIPYRYCRNGQCGSELGLATDQSNAGKDFLAAPQTQTVSDTITAWHWLAGQTAQATVLPNAIGSRGGEFTAGIELASAYHPSWDAYFPDAVEDVRDTGANWIFLTPTWTFGEHNPPYLSQKPGRDILWGDLIEQIGLAKEMGLKVGLKPQAGFPIDVDTWWLAARRDFSWWQVWFESYRTFALHFAELAQQQDLDSLVIGGDWVAPAAVGGAQLSDGSPSNVPWDAQERWQALIEELRARYDGSLIWALSAPVDLNSAPPQLALVDEIYVEWLAPLTNDPDTSTADLEEIAGDLLDTQLLPIQLKYDIPLTLAIGYPSARGGVSGCVPINGGNCLPLAAFLDGPPDEEAVQLDLEEQASAYNAVLAAVNERSWLTGVVSRGYFPPAILQDTSSSIHGKPAQDVLWFWFSGLTGETP